MRHVAPLSWKRLAVAPLFLLAAGIGVARSEGQEFRLYRFDREIGSESFEITPPSPEERVSVTASSKIDLAGRIVTVNQTLLADGRSYSLREYKAEAEVQGQKQSITARRTADSVVVEIRAGETALRRAFPAPGDVMVLDNLAMNHLALLAMRIQERGFLPETLDVVVPQIGALMSAQVLPEPPAADGSRAIRVTIGSVTETIRIGPSGRIDGADIPSQGLRFERATPGQPVRPAPPPPRTEDDRAIPESAAQPGRALFEERPVTFDSKGASLDGFLTLPRGGQKIPYPAVLFVHDAGAQDRDETLGPNRPFFEIARGLAVYGIASLRYDKRTLAAPQTVHPLRVTARDETIDDALAALEILRSEGKIDGRRIWILGHGLGGSLAPTIARGDGGIEGLVILGGSLRPLDAILRDRILGATGSPARPRSAVDSEARVALAMLDSLAAGTLPGDRMVMGIGSRYLADYRARDLAGDFIAFTGPTLLLFGGKDDQIGQADIDSWNTAITRAQKRNAVSRTVRRARPSLHSDRGRPVARSAHEAGTSRRGSDRSNRELHPDSSVILRDPPRSPRPAPSTGVPGRAIALTPWRTSGNSHSGRSWSRLVSAGGRRMERG